MAAIILEYVCSREMLEGTTETVNVMVCGPLCEPQLYRLNVTSRGLMVPADQHVHVVAAYSHLGAVIIACLFIRSLFWW